MYCKYMILAPAGIPSLPTISCAKRGVDLPSVGQKVGTIKVPMGMGDIGGGRSHAANEYYTVEISGKNGGMAFKGKVIAAAIFEYAKLTTTPPKPKTPAT